MKLIEQSYEICKIHGYTLQNIYRDIERAARVSYKSEDKITEDSAEKMVERLMNMKHYSPLEFGTIYLKVRDIVCCGIISDAHAEGCMGKPWVRVNKINEVEADGRHVTNYYITTNYRFIVENRLDKLIKYICEPTNNHVLRTMVKITCPRIISQMFMRHRVFSFLQESQRYVNYSKDKFGNEITYIIPVQCREDIKDGTEIEDPQNVIKFIWGERNTSETNLPKVNKFTQSMLFTFCTAETDYIGLVNKGYKPQQARAVLPNYTATSFYMCGFDDDWEKFFELRDKDVVDPQMYDLAHKLHLEFIEKGKCK